MSSRKTIIIIADSRGRGLDDFVGGYPTSISHDFVIEIHPGKSLHQLVPIIFSTLARYSLEHTYCIIFAGVCGLSDKTWFNNKPILRYESRYRDEKISSITDTLHFLKSNFGDHINICSIIPPDLIGYYKHFNKDHPVPDFLSIEQSALETDINIINGVILNLNSARITNINLSSRAQLKSKKKRQRSGRKVIYRRVIKFTYKDLVDGVHFSPNLKTIAFNLILSTATRDMNSLSEPNPNFP